MLTHLFRRKRRRGEAFRLLKLWREQKYDFATRHFSFILINCRLLSIKLCDKNLILNSTYYFNVKSLLNYLSLSLSPFYFFAFIKWLFSGMQTPSFFSRNKRAANCTRVRHMFFIKNFLFVLFRIEYKEDIAHCAYLKDRHSHSWQSTLSLVRNWSAARFGLMMNTWEMAKSLMRNVK